MEVPSVYTKILAMKWAKEQACMITNFMVRDALFDLDVPSNYSEFWEDIKLCIEDIVNTNTKKQDAVTIRMIK